MVKVFTVKVAVTLTLELIVMVQVGEVPVHAPDQPVNVELTSGVAVNVTTVPGLKADPAGLLVTVPIPEPLVFMARV